MQDDITFNPDEIRQAQERDPELSFLRMWLVDKGEPVQGELKLAGAAAKYYWVNKEMFFLSKNVIYKKGEEERDLLVIPRNLTKEVLRLLHDIPSAAHQGIDRTKDRVKKNSIFGIKCPKMWKIL